MVFFFLADDNRFLKALLSATTPNCLENVPTCYRAPKWPDPGISTKNTDKNTPRAESLEPQENKIPPKKKKRSFWYCGGTFSVFSAYFGGKVWESRISARGVFFRYFSWKFRVGPSRVFVAGRGEPSKMVAAALRSRLARASECQQGSQDAGNASRLRP